MCRINHYILLLLLTPLLLFAEEDRVTLQLHWLHQFQFAGYYVAKEKGFYREAGLEVEIREYAQGVDVVEEVVSGHSDFGIGRSSLILDYAAGKPVVALGAIYQSSPSVLITTDPTIEKPSDLKGKRVMVTKDQAHAAANLSMLLSQGLQLEDITIQDHSFRLNDLVEGKTDAMACYLSNEPYTLSRAGVAHRIFDPKEYGFHFLGDIIFTTNQQLNAHPERTRRFYEASIRGWQWAFEHIEETAELIHEHYNSQNKSLEHLVFEGKTLKSLAMGNSGKIGRINLEQVHEIANVYRLFGLYRNGTDLQHFADPLGFNKTAVKLGVLAKRGTEQTLKRWTPLANYLNRKLPEYHVQIVPIDFKTMYGAIQNRTVDFVLTNTMNYVQMENVFGIARIATLKNRSQEGKGSHNLFGGVIFAKKGERTTDIDAIRSHRFAAVDPNSFGGWVMAYELLETHGVSKEQIDLTFYGTHDDVVYAVLEGRADFGTVRSDTLERMADEGLVDLKQIQVIEPKHYADFNYLVSTKLYPEWPFAKLQHVSDTLASAIVSAMIQMPPDSEEAIGAEIGGWTVPLDYSSIHRMLRELKLPPYDQPEIGLKGLIERFKYWIYALAGILILFVARFVHVRALNRQLDLQIKERTRELSIANAHLRELANTDALTGIHNRGYFMEQAEYCFDTAKRNKTPLQVIMIDIDHFKEINDTYGHQTGDTILKLFCQTITPLLRRSDQFGRIGGEEFGICLQNTTPEGAESFAKRILDRIRELSYRDKRGNAVTFTVSIGLASLNGESTFDELLSKSDRALYRAKNAGRDRLAT